VKPGLDFGKSLTEPAGRDPKLDTAWEAALYLGDHQPRCSFANHIVRALRFFYGVTLRPADAFERMVAARQPRCQCRGKLPICAEKKFFSLWISL
jgi:hypothetical protein